MNTHIVFTQSHHFDTLCVIYFYLSIYHLCNIHTYVYVYICVYIFTYEYIYMAS